MDRNYYDSYLKDGIKNEANTGFAPNPQSDQEDELELSQNFKTARWTYSRLGFALLLLTVVNLIVQLILAIGAQSLEYLMYQNGTLKVENAFTGSSWYVWILSMIPLYGFALPAMYLCIRKMPKYPREKQKMGVGSWMLIAVIGIGCMLAGSLIGQLVMKTIDTVTHFDSTDALTDLTEKSNLWQVLFFTVICAPIGEEFIFRKLLIDRARGFGDKPVIIFSGLMFGLFHGNFNQAFYAFFLGILLAYIYTKTGKYYLCVLLHMFVNFMLGFVPLFAERLTAVGGTVNVFVGNLIAIGLVLLEIGCLIAGIVFCIVFARKAVYHKADLPLARRKSGKAVFGNAGVICALGGMAIVIILDIVLPIITEALS